MMENIMDLIYFIAHSKSPAAKLLDNYHNSVKIQRSWVRKFLKNHKLSNCDWIQYSNNIIGISPSTAAWNDFLINNPMWRKINPHRGCCYAIPRRKTKEQKDLYNEWSKKPPLMSVNAIKMKLTNVTDFYSWMKNNISYGIGWEKIKNNNYVIGIPYCVVRCKEFKPMNGCVLAPDQNKAREILY